MRIATGASIAVLALSTAALAQVSTPAQDQTANNMTVTNSSGPGNAAMPAGDTMSTADNMMDNSAAPPPSEPR